MPWCLDHISEFERVRQARIDILRFLNLLRDIFLTFLQIPRTLDFKFNRW